MIYVDVFKVKSQRYRSKLEKHSHLRLEIKKKKSGSYVIMQCAKHTHDTYKFCDEKVKAIL